MECGAVPVHGGRGYRFARSWRRPSSPEGSPRRWPIRWMDTGAGRTFSPSLPPHDAAGSPTAASEPLSPLPAPSAAATHLTEPELSLHQEAEGSGEGEQCCSGTFPAPARSLKRKADSSDTAMRGKGHAWG